MAAIYVELLVRAPLDSLWECTQNPTIHEQWDLRFSSIMYLPRASENEPQRFRYTTRIGFGLEIAGEGESKGDLASGARVSTLKFWSSHPLSLIREGGGYWKYIPDSRGIRFLTLYDYRTRYGFAGKLFDRIVFRPLLGWATAFSFDSMRLWLERGIHPTSGRIQAAVHTIARSGIAAVFAWQGFAPKLFRPSVDEFILLREAGIESSLIPNAVTAFGWAELVFAFLLLFFWRKAWPALLTMGLMVLATTDVALHSAGYLTAAFNPVSLNLSVMMIAAIDLIALRNLPSSAACLRKEPGKQ